RGSRGKRTSPIPCHLVTLSSSPYRVVITFRGGRADGWDDHAMAVALAAGIAVVPVVVVLRQLEAGLAGTGARRLDGDRAPGLQHRPGVVGHLAEHLQLPGLPHAQLLVAAWQHRVAGSPRPVLRLGPGPAQLVAAR